MLDGEQIDKEKQLAIMRYVKLQRMCQHAYYNTMHVLAHVTEQNTCACARILLQNMRQRMYFSEYMRRRKYFIVKRAPAHVF